MAESLGEKLRLAREERDISISEVAEQTRISALYLQAIENDDYRSLPGGIFNKGFVKSFAKYVGLDENEALQDYAKIVALEESVSGIPEPRNYKPEVLTDDSRGGSMLPTIVFAVVILGLMAWGILALVKYVGSAESGLTGNGNLLVSDTNSEPAETNVNAANNDANTNSAEPLPSTDSIKLKISTSEEALSVKSVVDGKPETVLLSGDLREKTFEAADSLVVSYYKGLAGTVSLELNGRKIETPMPPENYPNNGLEYEINKGNIKKILTDGKIELVAPAKIQSNSNVITADGNSNSGNAN